MRHSLLVYNPSIAPAEVNVLENMWRQRVHACVAFSRGSLLHDLVRHTPLPREVWQMILSYGDATLPRPVADLRYAGSTVAGRIFRVEAEIHQRV